VQWIAAGAVAVTAGWTDLRSRKIPNTLTLSGALLGIVVFTIAQGWRGAFAAISGAGVMFGLLLPVVLLRGLGAGDWKLMGALGAILGWKRVLLVLLASVFLAAALAMFLMIRQGRVKSTLKNLWELLCGFFFFGLQPNPEIGLENPAASTVPFGAAAAMATVLCYGLALAGR
jgi:prepilin peptidase CpaA